MVVTSSQFALDDNEIAIQPFKQSSNFFKTMDSVYLWYAYADKIQLPDNFTFVVDVRANSSIGLELIISE